MDDLARRHLGLDGIEKADELLGAVTLHVPPRDGSIEMLRAANFKPSPKSRITPPNGQK
jgi:hypothetical protein